MAQRYRERDTGRFVKESTWRQSKAQGGKRYKREKVTPPRKQREITPPPGKAMWRVTVSAPYYHRKGGKKRGSISSSYIVRGWYRTKAEAKKALEKLTDAAIDGRFTVLESDRKTWWNGKDDHVNTAIQSVPYDANLLDTTEEQDERITR